MKNYQKEIKLEYYESNVNKYLFWITISYNRKNIKNVY